MSPEEKKVRKILKILSSTKDVAKSKPGDIVQLRDGTRYRIGARGNWIKIGK